MSFPIKHSSYQGTAVATEHLRLAAAFPSTFRKPSHQTRLEIVSPTSSLYDCGSISPTTATNTFASTARDDPAGLIGMGKTTMAVFCLVEQVYTLGTHGISGRSLTPDRNGGPGKVAGCECMKQQYGSY